jgi:hypothetical protein
LFRAVKSKKNFLFSTNGCHQRMLVPISQTYFVIRRLFHNFR